MKYFVILLLCLLTACSQVPQPALVDIPATPEFRMSATEITNAQYEAFDPSHKALRGYKGFSEADDEAVVMVSWEEASAYCEWLSSKTGKCFRLPTESEWELACRAGTVTAYNTGDTFPEEQWKVQKNTRDKEPVSLQVAQFAPNAWGLYDMHGNVEEWCQDLVYGQYRAVRGGSHNTPVEFLATAYRSASIPQDRSVLFGFRVVEAPGPSASEAPDEVPCTKSGVSVHEKGKCEVPCTKRADSVHEKGKCEVPCTKRAVSVHEKGKCEGSCTKSGVFVHEGAFFGEPRPYVIEPVDGCTPFYSHNHQPAVCWLPGGGLLAIWFSTDAEAGREMVVLQSVFDGEKWSPATMFCKVPGRNMTGSALLTLDNGDILHFQGVGDAGEWKDLALAMRKLEACPASHHNTACSSLPNEAGHSHWTPLRYIEPEHEVRHQVIAGPIVTKDGRILLCCDAGPDGEAGTALHVSKDGGATWEDTGSLIKGIHAGIVELKDGRLMTFGRGNAIDGRMPCSLSADGGKTWEYKATEFPPIGSGQRLVLKRLQEGPIMLCSFGPDGLFVALSYDEGESWPVKKLLTDGKKRVLDGGAWTGKFTLDATHAEPKGYLACTQSPDGMIHLLSSRVHYQFNLLWIETK